MPKFVFAVFLSCLPALAARAEETQEVLKDLQKRVAALEGAPAKSSLSAFNPAMGLALDAAFSDENGKAAGHFRAAELSVEAPVDPYSKAWGVFVGSRDGVSVEEATLETTALPWSLTLRGGRLFASFGRLAHFHDHELPVIDRPRSLDAFVGGEARGDGLELSWVAPTPFYLRATAGAYNKLGAENDRVSDAGRRGLHESTYLARLDSYADVSDAHSVELGADAAWTPKRVVTDVAGLIETRRNTGRTLMSVDLTYRYQPAQGGLYSGLVWGTEVLRNDENRFDPGTRLPNGRRRSYAGYSYLEVKTGRRLRGGAMVDLTQDLDDTRRVTRTYTAFATFDATPFQRVRLSVAESRSNAPGAPWGNTVALQWTAVIGHHVHGFRDR